MTVILDDLKFVALELLASSDNEFFKVWPPQMEISYIIHVEFTYM